MTLFKYLIHNFFILKIYIVYYNYLLILYIVSIAIKSENCHIYYI